MEALLWCCRLTQETGGGSGEHGGISGSAQCEGRESGSRGCGFFGSIRRGRENEKWKKKKEKRRKKNVRKKSGIDWSFRGCEPVAYQSLIYILSIYIYMSWRIWPKKGWSKNDDMELEFTLYDIYK